MLGKLDKLKMPMPGKKKLPMDMAEEAPAEGEEMPEDVALEGDDMGEDGAQAPMSDLELVSDDELIAELQKRGIMGKLAGQGEEDQLVTDAESY